MMSCLMDFLIPAFPPVYKNQQNLFGPLTAATNFLVLGPLAAKRLDKLHAIFKGIHRLVGDALHIPQHFLLHELLESDSEWRDSEARLSLHWLSSV